MQNASVDTVTIPNDAYFFFNGRNERSGQQGAEDQILDEGLAVGKVDGLSEASAVHFRIEYDENKSQKGEESLENHGGIGCDLSTYTGDQGSSNDGFGKSECHSKTFGCKPQETNMQEFKVLFHYQSCAYRVKDLQYS